MDDELSLEEEAIYSELAQRAGSILQRRLTDDGVAFLDDLPSEQAREVMRSAWREAAAERFGASNVVALFTAIEEMIDSMTMDFGSVSRLH